MFNEKTMECPYCGSTAGVQIQEDFSYCFAECPVCGRYEFQSFPEIIGGDVRDEIAAYLFYTGKLEKHTDYRFFNFIGSKEYFDKIFEKYPWCHHVTLEEVNSFYPHTFSERITRILLGVAKKSDYFGDVVEYTHAQVLSAMFVRRFGMDGRSLDDVVRNEQLRQIIKYLEGNKFIETGGNYDKVKIIMLPDGWKRVDDLQIDIKNNKNVFVSMAFNNGTKKTREALREGIIKAGYSPEFIDEIIHNKQIVPEMFRLIRESRFLILEITDPNYGAYYEAGYALGLGKEVIICCKAEVFSKQYETEEEKRYQKYLKPHFDIAQKQILVWEDYNDLTKKLTEWIKAIV